MLSTTTSTSQGRRVPLFFGLFVFLFFISVSLLYPAFDSRLRPMTYDLRPNVPALLRGREVFARRFVRERDEPRLETRFVTIGRVHVAQLVGRRHGAAAGAHGDERAVVAHFPRRELLEVPQ